MRSKRFALWQHIKLSECREIRQNMKARYCENDFKDATRIAIRLRWATNLCLRLEKENRLLKRTINLAAECLEGRSPNLEMK